MGIGTPDSAISTAKDWNSGACDILAVALHRMYGFPIIAEFEWGFVDGQEVLGYLRHAWVRLPDGRDMDASGPRAPFKQNDKRLDPDDPWVEGYKIVEIAHDDPHLLESREEDDYVESIRVSGANSWITNRLSKHLTRLRSL